MTIPHSQTPIELTEDDEIVLHVRDIRKSNYYVVDNTVMDEWVPLIGDIGYTIYSLLIRVSNRRDGESARVSFRLLKQHLGYSSATVMTYIRFLEICQLIYRDRPEILVEQSGEVVKKRVGNRSNTYYILEMHSVTPEELDALKQAVLIDKQIDDGFRKNLVKRINNWKPISKLWTSQSKKRVKTVVTQASLFNDDVENDDSPTPSADPVIKRILEKVNIRDEQIITDLSDHEPSLILAVIWHGRTEDWIDPARFSGYVIRSLEKSTYPPDGFVELAELWLGMSQNQRREMVELRWQYYDYPHHLIDDLDIEITEQAASAAISFNRVKTDSFQNWIDIN